MANNTFPQNKKRFIGDYIDPTDKKIYHWVISNNNSLQIKIIFFALYFFTYYFLMQGIMWGMLKLISLLSESAATIIGLIFLALFFFTIFLVFFDYFKIPKRTGISMYLMMSSGIIFYLVSSPGSVFQSGFMTATSFEEYEWLRFFIQHGLNVLLIDIPDTFDYQISNIQPVLWHAKIITVIIKFFASAGFVQLIANLYITIFYSKNFYGTLRDCVEECLNYLDVFGLGGKDTGLSYVLVRKKTRENEQDIPMVPKGFLEYLKRSKLYDDLFDPDITL